MLELFEISYHTGGQRVLNDVSCRFESGKITALVGPNGAGKTSLLRIAAGLVSPVSGRIEADGDFADADWRARHIAYLPQFQNVAWPLSCRDVVALGLAAQTAVDWQKVEAALTLCRADGFAMRGIDTLSGGEAARVHLARLMVADAPLLLLDEPAQSLDASGAQIVMQLLREAANAGKAVVLVMHDLNLAQAYCDHIVLMQAGSAVAQGTPSEVFTPALLTPIFGVEFTQIEASGTHYIVPRR